MNAELKHRAKLDLTPQIKLNHAEFGAMNFREFILRLLLVKDDWQAMNVMFDLISQENV